MTKECNVCLMQQTSYFHGCSLYMCIPVVFLLLLFVVASIGVFCGCLILVVSYFFVFSQLKLSVCAELQRRAMTSARRSINGNCRTHRPSPPCQTLSPGWTPRHDAVNFVSCVGRYASLVSGKPGALSLTCSFALGLEWNTSSSDA